MHWPDTARLQAVLATATGLPAKAVEVGAVVMFPTDQVRAFQRTALIIQGSNIHLRTWPAELAPQYKFVYADPKKVEALIALHNPPDWTVEPNFHLAYWLAAAPKRWYPSRHLTGAEYLRQWIYDLRDHRVGRRPLSELKDATFRQWLVERRYASEQELTKLDSWAATLPRDHFDIRPSIEVTRSWQIAEAEELDRTGRFVTAVREGIDQILVALGEMQL